MDAETRRVIRTGDPIPAWARAIVGHSMQLRIPLRDPIDLRRAAEILRQFANRLEVLSARKDEAHSILLAAVGERRITQGRLQSLGGADRKSGGI
jgi:hypothetical protein